jgi:hypothetical protein
MSAPDRDPFGLGGTMPTAPEAADENIIVDEAAKEALPLVDGEPTLGPLVRELFQIEEEQGNMASGPAGNPERWDDLARRFNALEAEITACRAETTGGIAWRLTQVLAIDDGLSTWTMAMLKAAIDDAKALAGLNGLGEDGTRLARRAPPLP